MWQPERFGQALTATNALSVSVVLGIVASGLLVNGDTATTLKAVGVTGGLLDNSAGLASAISGTVSIGVWGPFANSSAGDQIALADVGSDCYIVDNQTLAKTSGSSTRSIAGKVWDVTTDGVWVKFA